VPEKAPIYVDGQGLGLLHLHPLHRVNGGRGLGLLHPHLL